jgi:hypothetical protein
VAPNVSAAASRNDSDVRIEAAPIRLRSGLLASVGETTKGSDHNIW